MYGFLFSIVLVAVGLDGAAALGIFKRDDTVTPTPLSTVFIPLTVNSEQRYVVGVNMSSDPDTQSFKFALAANTGYTAVAGTNCASCEGTPSYNSSASSTAQQLPGSGNFSVGSASFSGPFFKENCGLHESNGTAWQYPNQTIIVSNSSSSLFTNVTSGIAGLGTLANGANGDFLDTIFGQWLDRNPTHNNFSYGMDLKPPTFTSDDDSGNGGILHWVVPDSSAYEGSVTWTNATVSAAQGDVASASSSDASGVDANSNFSLPESDWTFELDGWAASIAGTAISNSSQAKAIVEPYFPDIYFPASQAELYYAAVSGASQTSSLVQGAQAWNVPCGSPLSVAFTVQGQAFPLDSSILVQQQGNGTCIGTIKAWPDPTVQNFLLGSNFISQYYIIFIIGRPGSGVNNQIGFANRASSSSSTNIGAIVGGAVGGTVAVAILVALAFWLGRRSKKSRIILSVGPSDKDNEKLSIMSDSHKRNESAHYTVNSLSPSTPVSAFTPPQSARSVNSTYPLLPEAQSPITPAFGGVGYPNTPNSPSNFLSMSSHASNGQSPTTFGGASGGHISYNQMALGANVGTSHASQQEYGIQPYILPAASGSYHSLSAKERNLQTSAGSHDERILDYAPPAGTQGSTLPETSSSADAYVEPFILSPAPRVRSPRYERKNGGTDRAGDVATPGPPAYSEGPGNTLSPVSPTLVEYSPTTDEARSRPTTGSL